MHLELIFLGRLSEKRSQLIAAVH